MLQFCERHDLAFLSRAPFGCRGHAPILDEHAPMFAPAAGTRRVSVQRLALARLLGRSESIILIARPSQPESIQDFIEAARLELAPSGFDSVASTVLPTYRPNQERTAACANRSAAT